MGKQVNFYLTGADEAILLDAIASRGLFSVWPGVSRKRPDDLRLPLKLATSKTRFSDVHVCIVPRFIEAKVVAWRVDGSYSIDYGDSEVIEFTRSQLIDGSTKQYGPKPKLPWLNSGRLWFDAWDLSRNPKSEAFAIWANGVLATVRRKFKSNGFKWNEYTYASPDARRQARARQFRLG